MFLKRKRLERQASQLPVIRIAALERKGNNTFIWTHEDISEAAERAAQYFSQEEYFDSDEYFVRHFMRMCDPSDPRVKGE